MLGARRVRGAGARGASAGAGSRRAAAQGAWGAHRARRRRVSTCSAPRLAIRARPGDRCGGDAGAAGEWRAGGRRDRARPRGEVVRRARSWPRLGVRVSVGGGLPGPHSGRARGGERGERRRPRALRTRGSAAGLCSGRRPPLRARRPRRRPLRSLRRPRGLRAPAAPRARSASRRPPPAPPPPSDSKLP